MRDLDDLSADELDLVEANRSAVDEMLGPDISGDDRASRARQLLALMLSVYREARIAGVCHDGACEVARDRAQVEATEVPHDA